MLEAICNVGFNLKLYCRGGETALPRLRVDSHLQSKYSISPLKGADY